MSIADVLQHKGHEVVRIRTTDTVQFAVRCLAEHRIGAVVVEDPWMHIAGIFSERDLLNAIAGHGDPVLREPVERFMTSPVLSCAPNDRVEAAMATMTLAKIRHLPVRQDGRLVGIVSIGDLVKHRLDEKSLEANVLLDLSRMRV